MKGRMNDARDLTASRVFFVLSNFGCPTTPLDTCHLDYGMRLPCDDTNDAIHWSNVVENQTIQNKGINDAVRFLPKNTLA